MAAPTNAANVKKALANAEPSTHGTFETPPGSAKRSPTGGKADVAADMAVSAIYQFRELTQAGGLASHAIRLTDAYHQSGVYVGRILRGAAARELPFVWIDRVELVINLRTAKALGPVLSNSMQLLAYEVIE